MIVGVLSDTHLQAHQPLPARVLEALSGCAAILHAGDVACREVLAALGTIAPVHAVRGNVDPPDLDLPARVELRLGAFTLGLTHGHLGTGRTTEDRALGTFPGVDVVVFGHSHRPVVHRVVQGPLVVNPGSPTQPRGLQPTLALLDLSGPRPEARLIALTG